MCGTQGCVVVVLVASRVFQGTSTRKLCIRKRRELAGLRGGVILVLLVGLMGTRHVVKVVDLLTG